MYYPFHVKRKKAENLSVNVHKNTSIKQPVASPKGFLLFSANQKITFLSETKTKFDDKVRMCVFFHSQRQNTTDFSKIKAKNKYLYKDKVHHKVQA